MFCIPSVSDLYLSEISTHLDLSPTSDVRQCVERIREFQARFWDLLPSTCCNIMFELYAWTG